MTRAAELRFAGTVAGVFLAVSLAKIFTHEPWRDEWGPWGIASASEGLRQLWQALPYEGHSRLWYFLVFALERTTGRFEAVQLLSAVLATLSVWVVARFAPFGRWARGLFALGYYPLFEYGSIARPYSIALAAACVAACCFSRARREPLPLAVALAVLAQTTIYGVILAAAFGAAWLADRVSARLGDRAGATRSWIAAGIIGVSLVAAVAQMVPPSDSKFARRWHTHWEPSRVVHVVATVARGVAPLPRPQAQFWNSHVLDRHLRIKSVVGAAILVGSAALLVGSPPALVLWIVASAGLLGFEYLKYEGYARHQGHLFLAFLTSAWLVVEAQQSGRSRTKMAAAWPVTLGLVLTVNAAAGLLAVAIDAALPFSTAAAAAQAIRARGLADLPAVGRRGSTTAAVAAALGRPIALAGTGRVSTFVRWDRTYAVPSLQRTLQEARRLAAARHSAALLILDTPLLEPGPRVVRVASMEEPIVRDERFHLYLVRP
ncbi:MAG: hypothetical protein HY899_17800 [Deltaproteobacteria bacterium]|nr:hypothetical protein [Deltaproteobacteria bacterium]